ncbi:hypothetical protein EJ02DRAFT_157351 [Clathrospora elynae]|uniref:Uncharacterized protein n=1 Tax=Clathrospora elynae TaxID=706981 RepID=A0A6A5SW74_9PLEO|nr:hypothetical protein EJ02DRAFT_157351 [Clathrospora elynae]
MEGAVAVSRKWGSRRRYCRGWSRRERSRELGSAAWDEAGSLTRAEMRRRLSPSSAPNSTTAAYLPDAGSCTENNRVCAYDGFDELRREQLKLRSSALTAMVRLAATRARQGASLWATDLQIVLAEWLARPPGHSLHAAHSKGEWVHQRFVQSKPFPHR